MISVDVGDLETFARTSLQQFVDDEDDARAIAASLVGSDLAGHRSHGVLRVPSYANMVERGWLNPSAEPTLERESPTTARLDARRAFGQLVGRRAVELLTEKARAEGVATVGISDSGHLGRIGEWADAVASEGLCFAAFVNLEGGAQRIAPPGSADRRLGTNPVAFALPTFDALPFEIVLDMATSQVAHGKIIERDGSEKTLPESWTIETTGEPVDVAAAFEDGVGALLPVGGRDTGHKGYGLAVIAELFAATMGGGSVSTDPEQGWNGNAATFVAIDPERFTDRETMADNVTALRAHLRSADPTDDYETDTNEPYDVLLPGESEYRTARKYRRNGVPFPEQVLESLRTFAVERDIEDVLPAPFESR